MTPTPRPEDAAPLFVVRQFEGRPWVPLHEAARLHDAVQEAGVTIAGLRNLIAARAPVPEADALREALERLPRLWWCGGWGTLNEKRYHGAGGPCHLPPPATCGEIAYVRDSDLRAALATRSPQ